MSQSLVLILLYPDNLKDVLHQLYEGKVRSPSISVNLISFTYFDTMADVLPSWFMSVFSSVWMPKMYREMGYWCLVFTASARKKTAIFKCFNGHCGAHMLDLKGQRKLSCNLWSEHVYSSGTRIWAYDLLKKRDSNYHQILIGPVKRFSFV